MNILIVANHFAVCSARYAADAFTRLGHTVKHVGRPMGRDIWGMQVPEEYVWTPNYVYDGDEINLVVYMDSDPAILDTDVPTLRAHYVTWGVDNHVRRYEREGIDWYFLAHKSVSIQPYTENTTWLPCGYDGHCFTPSPIAWNAREFDVCLIGVLYPKRWELVNAMRDAGLKVFAGTGLVYDAYRDAHHNSRVALVSSFNGDLPIRLFEGAGMGCAVLCDQVMDLMHLEQDDVTPWIYRDTEHAVELAKLLQSTPEMGEECVQWATPHTWDARAQVIINWLEARNVSA
jgi:hypothetical protein